MQPEPPGMAGLYLNLSQVPLPPKAVTEQPNSPETNISAARPPYLPSTPNSQESSATSPAAAAALLFLGFSFTGLWKSGFGQFLRRRLFRVRLSLVGNLEEAPELL